MLRFHRRSDHQAALQYQTQFRIAIILIVTKDKNSCSVTRCGRFKTLLVTICLQRCLLANQLFPRVPT